MIHLSLLQHPSEAEIDLHVTYSNHISPFIISWKQLAQMVSDKQFYNEGLKVFVQRKKQETLKYARYHFRKDRFFKVDSISLSKDFVSLHMSYNDTKVNLRPAFLGTSKVSLHYTDKVGDMGSTLNNMLSICVRTNKGFAFIYTARKSHKVQKCKYSAERAKKTMKAQRISYG